MNESKNILQILTTGFVGNILSAVVIFVVGYIAIQILSRLLKNALRKTKLEKAAHSLIVSLAKTTLYVLLIIALVKHLGIDVTGVVALASVLTLAVSMSMQNILTNVMGGFTLLYNHPFHSGDFVEIAGQSGTVKDINMAYTRLTTPDNKVISIPNSAVVSAQIVNFSASGTRRVDLAVTASYDAPTCKVVEALLEAGRVEKVLADPAPFAAVDNYGDSAISYVLRLWVKTEDYWDVYFGVNKRIKDIFDEQNIEMTYPHLNVHLDKLAN